MTEQELQQYLLSNYPKENEGCEWKEFKSLKNDFNGKEKEDVISYVSALANMEGGHLVIGVVDKTLEIVGTDTYNYDLEKARLRLTSQCVNLPSEGLSVEEFITVDTQKTVWVIHVPRHMMRRPVYAHNKAWQRMDDSHPELDASQIYMLDRVAKGLPLQVKQTSELLAMGLVVRKDVALELAPIATPKHINTSDQTEKKAPLENTPYDTPNVVSNVVSNVGSHTKGELTERQMLVFLQIEHNNYVTTAKMSEALKVTTRTIDRELAVLRKFGYIVKKSKDNKSPWLVLKRPK